mgnify:CR=1 FL=1
MATYCMAKFWNLDTFIDQERIYQKRTMRKKTIAEFIRERALNLDFMTNNGNELQKANFGQHIKTFLEAYVDPRVETYTRTVGVHNVLEMTQFLRMIGSQKIQCTLNLDDYTVSFVFKTTGETVDYIRVIRGRQDGSTINLDVDLKCLAEPSYSNLLKIPAVLFSHNLNIKKLWNTFKLFVAIAAEALTSNLQTPRPQN